MSLNDVQTNHGTSGTTTSRATDLISYEDLYARWEQGNWSAMELDFSEDARQWREEMTQFERTAALWNYALFFWGEDAVADNLSPYIDAAPLEEQKYFLATQQVDEARHAIFFKRFMHEVCGIGDGTMAGGLGAIEPQLTWGFRRTFERLDTIADELRADRSLPKLSAAVTLYHMVVEATLAQPGQHFITNYLEKRDMLPAFRAGMEQIARDEQRHIGFGVKLLADVASGDERCRRAVADVRARSLLGGRRCCSRPAGTATTPRPSASRSRRSPRRASARCRRSCAARGCRWTSCRDRRSSRSG
jgi:ribonucleotide reductase beta subunit family protein with ferritin-like domain